MIDKGPGQSSVHEVRIGGEPSPFRLHRTGRRTLEIAVTAAGEIEVRAPRNLPLPFIESRLRAKAAWIGRKQRERSLEERGQEPVRRYRAGASHRYLGRQYRLELETASPPRVRVHGGRLRIGVPDPGDEAVVKLALDRWMRVRARCVLTERVATLTARPEFEGLRPTAVRVQAMRHRWGSCSGSGRLLLNPELVALPLSLIDYVIAHELCHLRVRRHDLRFERLLARVMPDWRTRHRRLARSTVE